MATVVPVAVHTVAVVGAGGVHTFPQGTQGSVLGTLVPVHAGPAGELEPVVTPTPVPAPVHLTLPLSAHLGSAHGDAGSVPQDLPGPAGPDTAPTLHSEAPAALPDTLSVPPGVSVLADRDTDVPDQFLRCSTGTRAGVGTNGVYADSFTADIGG